MATHLIEAGEWTARLSPLSVGRRKYYAAKQRYIPLRRRLAHTYDGDFEPLSDAEATLAVIGHALNVVRPRRLTLGRARSSDPLLPQGCGGLADLAVVAVTEIGARVAANSANSNPAW